MGCSNQKSISVSGQGVFANGKIVQLPDGNFYLQKSRYHDKLLPHVSRRFEEFHLRHIEDYEKQKELQAMRAKEGRRKGGQLESIKNTTQNESLIKGNSSRLRISSSQCNCR